MSENRTEHGGSRATEQSKPQSAAPKLVKHGTPSDPDASNGESARGDRSTKPPAGKGSSTKPPAGKGSSTKPPAGKGSSAKPPGDKGGSATPHRATKEKSKPQESSERAESAAGSGSSSRPEGKDRKPGSGTAAPRPKTAGDIARESPKSNTSSTPTARTQAMPAVKDERSSQARTEPVAAGSRQARLKLVYVEPWSVAKVTFALTVALAVVAVVAVSILWLVLSFTGVWDQINSSVTTVLSDDTGAFDITDYLGFGRMVGFTIVLMALNTVVMTSIAVIGSHLYNLAGQLLGGVDLTLSEDN